MDYLNISELSLFFSFQTHIRDSGRLIIVNGATGKSLGRYFEMPEGKETYMSPIMHERKDGSLYILFGHGGETVPGLSDLFDWSWKLLQENSCRFV